MAAQLHELRPSNELEEIPSLLVKTNCLVTLKFVDVVCRIKPTKKAGLLSFMDYASPPNSIPAEKTILKGITGMVCPGQMLAVLGPSGSGKTTLLNALGGRLTSRVSGSITFNDQAMSKATVRSTGFVSQHDILYPYLTVTETLVFTARLRLPKNVSREEKEGQAKNVIKILGLANCKDSIIGSATVRGISGGERKRVSIGQEMLINPSLLLLDEPTSGLDSTTAQKIVSTLGDLAKCGKTVLTSIHQPSSKIFYMFDKVMLLSEGSMVYFGEGSKVLDYFSKLGHSMKVAMNPAEFLLDLANGISYNGSEDDPESVKQSLITAYNRESISKDTVQETVRHRAISSIQSGNTRQWSSSWWEEFVVLFQRGVKERRHASFKTVRIFQVACITLITSLLWWQSDHNNIQDKAGFLFYSPFYWNIITTLQAVYTFPLERAMLMKERTSGMYRLSSYLMARTVGDVPIELLHPLFYILVTYWMTGLKPSLWSFLLTTLTLLYGSLVAESQGLAVGAAITDPRSGAAITALITQTSTLAGGFYVQHVPGFMAWLQYISPSYYTYKLLLNAQYSENERYKCGDDSYCYVRDASAVRRVGLGQVWLSLMALLVMLLGYRLLAYALLLRMKKR